MSVAGRIAFENYLRERAARPRPSTPIDGEWRYRPPNGHLRVDVIGRPGDWTAFVIDSGNWLAARAVETKEDAMRFVHDCLDAGLRSRWTPTRDMAF